MRYILLITGFFLFPACVDAVSLNTSVTVGGKDVKVSDIFKESGNDSTLMEAPEPGRTTVLERGQLMTIARAHNIDWKPIKGFERVEIQSASRKIEDPEIITVLEAKFAEQIPSGQDMFMTFDRARPDLYASANFQGPIEVQDFQVKGQRFYAKIKADGPKVIQISGKAEPVLQVPVLTRIVNPGDVIETSDIETKEMAQSELKGRVILDADSLIGTTPRHKSLMAGDAVRTGDVQKPTLIKRGDVVDMSYRRGSVEIVGRGQAMDMGGMGDSVRIKNPSSNKIVTGLITGHNQVEVGF